ncbi:G5P family DNA-binding protein [Xanthomonas campestris]|uniref:G5P family DNA-binding protein n=1 Tax=Xanthomonas campestris TaxID=339 RepID=UPI001E61E691|nr:G5P family DNA-binding protein [Xanthomonas campestris]MCC5067066.1 G5P family DNA-binding protein [Xanthomonas campestris]
MNCILIRSSRINVRRITRKDGTSVVFNEQVAAIDKGDDFPSAFTINLADDQPPFPEGRYLLDPSSLEVGDFKSLKVGRRILLIPIPANAPTQPGKVG